MLDRAMEYNLVLLTRYESGATLAAALYANKALSAISSAQGPRRCV
jgi:hypothetical protein